MELKASLQYTKVGAQRARLVADLVRGKNVNEAMGLLSFSKKKSAGLIKALIQSAVANAEVKKVVDVDNLYVKTIYVNQGPHLKRYRPAARGQASHRKKKQSHIHIVLDER
jgi:large subunit ribosomal protein L22